jgi:hypothetical protein
MGRPASKAEAALLADCRRWLGFDPTAQPERQRDTRDGEPRCPKTLVRTLSGGDWEREACCWRETPLAELRKRDRNNGLKSYIDSLAETLPRLLGGPAESAQECPRRVGRALQPQLECSSSHPARRVAEPEVWSRLRPRAM